MIEVKFALNVSFPLLLNYSNFSNSCRFCQFSTAAMEKVIAFVKGLVIAQKKEAGLAPRDGWATAAMQAHADGEDTLMAADVFEDEKMEDPIITMYNLAKLQH